MDTNYKRIDRLLLVFAQILYGFLLGSLVLIIRISTDQLQIIGDVLATMSCILALCLVNHEYRTGEPVPTIWIQRAFFLLTCGMVFLAIFILQPL